LIHLVIRSSAHWELEATNTAGQFSVHLRVSVESVVHTTALLLVENDLQDLASVLLGSESLSNNLDWVNDVGEDGFVDRGQSSAARTLLSLRGAGSVGSLWAGEDATGSDEQNVAVGELLLELTGQTLLNLVEAGEERDGDEDDDRTLAVADFELASRDELKRSQGRLEVRDVGLEFIEGSRDAGFQLGWVLPRRAVVGDLVEGFQRSQKFDALLGGAEEVLGDLGVRRAMMKMPKAAL